MTMDAAGHLRHAQAKTLRNGTAEDRLIFHSLLGNAAEITALEGFLGASLLWRVLHAPESIDGSAATMEPTAANRHPWLAGALARIFLQRDDVAHAVTVAKLFLEHGNPDTSVLALVGRYLLSRGQNGLAGKVLGSALQIAPEQRDVAALHAAALRGEKLPMVPDLRPLPPLLRVGFYLPLFNVADHVRPALEGILAQCYPLHEILVIDDGSTDGSAERAGDYPVRIIRHGDNRGLAAARNNALAHMTADYVAAIDADVIPDTRYIHFAMTAFEGRDERFAGTGGRLIEAHTDTPADHWRSRFLSQDGGKLPWYMDTPPKVPRDEEEAAFYDPGRHFLPGNNTLFRREALMAAGGYDVSCRTNGEDVALCAALKRSGYHYAFTPHAVARHQRRDTPVSVIRTAWRYACHLRESQGFYANTSGLAALLDQHVARARWGFEKDIEDGCLDCLFIDLLYLFQCHALDAQHMAVQGMLPERRAMQVVDVLLAEFAALDERHRGDCRAGIVALLAEAGFSIEGQTSVHGVPQCFREGVAAARDWFATIDTHSYEALAESL